MNQQMQSCFARGAGVLSPFLCKNPRASVARLPVPHIDEVLLYNGVVFHIFFFFSFHSFLSGAERVSWLYPVVARPTNMPPQCARSASSYRGYKGTNPESPFWAFCICSEPGSVDPCGRQVVSRWAPLVVVGKSAGDPSLSGSNCPSAY